MSAAHPMSRLEQVQAMPPEAMIPAHVAQDAVEEAMSSRLPAAIEREMTLRMWAKLATANLLVGLPRADDDGTVDDEWARAFSLGLSLARLLRTWRRVRPGAR